MGWYLCAWESLEGLFEAKFKELLLVASNQVFLWL